MTKKHATKRKPKRQRPADRPLPAGEIQRAHERAFPQSPAERVDLLRSDAEEMVSNLAGLMDDLVFIGHLAAKIGGQSGGGLALEIVQTIIEVRTRLETALKRSEPAEAQS
jgi:hypothetical protein